MGCTATSKAAPPASTTGNPILGTAPVKRALLQYTFVALLVLGAWHNVLPRLSVKALLPAVVLESEVARIILQAATIAFALTLALLPFVMCPRLPPKPSAGTAWTNDPDFLSRIGVVIPCHKSADEIGGVLKQALKYFKPEHIVVADNANHPLPPDDTATVVKATDKLIKYLYIPHGHKTRALVHGTLELPSSVEYVLHLDDDTMLSDSMVFDEAKFSDDPAVSGVTFGIRMMGDSLVSRCVDWEFVLFSIYRTFMAERSTAFFCHGIVGLWRRERWMRILETHAAMPYGEDAWIGSDAISNDERIAAELRCWVRTYAPSRLLPACGCVAGAREQGYGASSIWKQRAMRWYTNAPRRLLIRLSQFVHFQAGSFTRNVWFRAFMLFHMVQVAHNVLAPLYIAHSALRSPADAAHTVRYLVLALGAFRYIKSSIVAAFVSWRDPDLRAQFVTLLAYPFYLLFLDVCFVYGHWRSLLYYNAFFPLQRHKPKEWIGEHAEVAAGSRAAALEDGGSTHSSLSSSSEPSIHPPKRLPKVRAPRPSAETRAGSTDASAELKAAPPDGAHQAKALESITVVQSPSME